MEKKETALLEFIHELMILMPIINKSATFISKGISGKPDIPLLILNANNILEVTETINTHLTLLNIDLNPQFYEIQKPQLCNIHGAFNRCSKFLKSKARAKDLQIHIRTGGNNNIPEVLSLKIVTVIPYIIFDNCIKYSIKSSTIDVEFTMNVDELNILISSEGPKVSNSEIPRLIEKGYRGENAKSINPNGKGLGLYYLKTICDLCKINLTISSSNKSYYYEDSEYSNFSICLDIKLT